jgi:hypothetical protein
MKIFKFRTSTHERRTDSHSYCTSANPQPRSKGFKMKSWKSGVEVTARTVPAKVVARLSRPSFSDLQLEVTQHLRIYGPWSRWNESL